MRFIHCADVHLDTTPLQGLARYPGAPVTEIRSATRRAFEKVLDTAVSEHVDFLIIAGDSCDTGLKSFESVLFFNKQMARLKDICDDEAACIGDVDIESLHADGRFRRRRWWRWFRSFAATLRGLGDEPFAKQARRICIVIDAEHELARRCVNPRAAVDHLVKADGRLEVFKENDIADARHIHARRQEIV
jgi:3',5'-cyclic AMP phosphodiesterase CpdA